MKQEHPFIFWDKPFPFWVAKAPMLGLLLRSQQHAEDEVAIISWELM